MPLSAGPITEKAYLLQWEPAYYITPLAWTASGNAFYTTVAAGYDIGEPSKIEADGELFIEEDSQAHCETYEKTWWWESPNLFVHCSGHVSPATLKTLSYFWELYGSHSALVIDGKYYLPYLNVEAMPQISSGTSSFHEGGTRQSFGDVKLLNADGYFDARLSKYIHEAKLMKLLVGDITINSDGVITAPSANFSVVWNGWSGDITWSDEEVSVATEDLRTVLY